MLIEVPGGFLEIACQATAIDARGVVNMPVNDAVVFDIVGFFWRKFDNAVYPPR